MSAARLTRNKSERRARRYAAPLSGLSTCYATSRLAAASLLLGIVLLIYLPFENAVLSVLPAPLFWPFRLAPDGIIAALALGGILERRDRNETQSLLALSGVVVCALVIIYGFAGVGATDTVNATRVVLRYPILALLIWRYARYWPGYEQDLLAALVTFVLLTIATGIVEVGLALVTQHRLVVPLAGATGRYDRFGLISMAAVIILSAAVLPRHRTAGVGALIAASLLLFASTSRQAVAGTAVGLLVLSLAPLVIPRLGTGSRASPTGAHRPAGRDPIAPRMSAAAVGFGGVTVLLVVLSLIPLGTPSPTVIVSGSSAPEPVASSGPTPTSAARSNGGARAGFSLSLDPNRNFRLFYNIVVVPEAVREKPLFGFGPRALDPTDPDPAMRRLIESHGMAWSWASRYVDDSNYASLIVKFGLPATGVFVLAILLVLRAAISPGTTASAALRRVVVGTGIAILAVAWLGPAFELRPLSAAFWIPGGALLGLNLPSTGPQMNVDRA